jgi:hypothetical protein
VSGDLLLLLGPPSALLAVAAAACLWLLVGERSRLRRRDELLAALQIARSK